MYFSYSKFTTMEMEFKDVVRD